LCYNAENGSIMKRISNKNGSTNEKGSTVKKKSPMKEVSDAKGPSVKEVSSEKGF